jgi:hypothetical protein
VAWKTKRLRYSVNNLDGGRDLKALAILILAATLEAGGDALVRYGMRGGRIAGFVAGGIVMTFVRR